MDEAPIPLDIPPGVVTKQSPLARKARWSDANWVRFWRGRAQKIGGYENLIEPDSIRGRPRGAHQWNDFTARQLIGVGTEYRLYYIPNTDYVPLNITPIASSTTLTNAISTTIGLSTVTIDWAAHGGVVGQGVNITGATAVGGITLNGDYVILTAATNSFTIDAGTNATSTAGPAGGAAIAAKLELAPGIADPASGYGWGAGTWGTGTWGTARSSTGLSFFPRFWTLSNFGRVLIAVTSDGAVYKLDPADPVGTRATYVTNAPTYCLGGFVTSEQILLCYGTNFDPALPGVGAAADQDFMQWWCAAQGDYTDWDTTSTGTANGTPSASGRLSQGSRIVGGADLGIHISLLWTDTALYQFQYSGSQFVFNILLAGTECGLAGPLAFVTVGSEAYWLSPNGLFMYNGGVQRIPNYQDVSEYIIEIMRPYYTIKTVAFYNQRYNEVWFVFCANTDIDRMENYEPIHYAIVNRDDWSWSIGTFPNSESITCATRVSPSDPRPLVFGGDGDLYQMDNGLDADGEAISWSLKIDGIEAGRGEFLTEIYGIAADMERQTGDITVLVEGFDRTNADAEVFDEDTTTLSPSTKIEDLRMSGRALSVTFSGSALGDDFRMGVPKLLTRRGAGWRGGEPLA